MSEGLVVGPDVATAIAGGRPVVALESALVTHGFAYPDNLAITRRMAGAIRDQGAVPAVVGIWQGQPTVGLSDEQTAVLAADQTAVKVSVRDLGLARLRGVNGGTTVAATSLLAHRAGIRVFATGGIGGVHRGHPEDVSADLPVLAQTSMVIVSAGAKSILDLPRTLEFLETWGVPVVGWRTEEFPAFYSRRSGLPVDLRATDAGDIAGIVRTQHALDLPQAVLVVVPVAETDEVPAEVVEPLIARALDEAETAGISGKALTPYLLARLVALSGSATQRANESLLVHNAQVAAQCATALANATPEEDDGKIGPGAAHATTSGAMVCDRCGD
jgi:pseudouridine-5'-phosphate glycosidase